jgi:hypothetical protein
MTAVEWLFEQVWITSGEDLPELLEQAKEMEKQQQGYSEEEVIAFGEFIFKHSLLTHTRGVKSLFEQFIKQLKKK